MPVLRPVLVRQDPASYVLRHEPPGVPDDLAWISGYIDGKGKREREKR